MLKSFVPATCVKIEQNFLLIRYPEKIDRAKLDGRLAKINTALDEAIVNDNEYDDAGEKALAAKQQIEQLFNDYPDVLFVLQMENGEYEMTTYGDIVSNELVAGFILMYPRADFAEKTIEDYVERARWKYIGGERRALLDLFAGKSANICVFRGLDCLCSCGCDDGCGSGMSFREYEELIEKVQ